MSERNLSEHYFFKLRQKLVFHMREVSNDKKIPTITPRAFHHEVLPNFAIAFRPLVTEMFFEMTEMYPNKWIYHRLKERWIDFDLK
jgi:hypothetical protein